MMHSAPALEAPTAKRQRTSPLGVAASDIEMAAADDTRPVDLLVVTCSPTSNPLQHAIDEAMAVQTAAEKHGKRVEKSVGCTAQELRALLAARNPRILLFIGHGDAQHRRTRKLTLGLTDAAGGAVLIDPKTLANVLRSAPDLKLLVLAGCESEALGIEVAKGGGVPTVCWRTKLLDEAASSFSTALFDYLLHPSRAAVPLRKRLPQAFKQGELAVATVHSKAGDAGEQYALDNPADYRGADGRITGRLDDGRQAAGLPVLLQSPAVLHGLPARNALTQKMWVPRDDLQRQLRDALGCGKVAVTGGGQSTADSADAGAAALHGTAGVGKTSMASWLVHDPEVQLRFPDGVFWITIGITAKEGKVAEGMSELQDALTDPVSTPPRRLVVLDDVWDYKTHVQPFEDVLSGKATLLLTTRNSDLANAFAGDGGGGRVLSVDLMAEDQALVLLSNHIGRDVRADATAIALVKQCYCLPIAVRAVADLVREGSSRVRKGILGSALKYLKAKEAERLKLKLPDSQPRYAHKTLFHALEASLDALSEELQTRAMQLGIFPEDEQIPYSVLQQLWGVDLDETLDTLDELKKWHLVEVNAKNETASLLDLHRDYLRCRDKSLSRQEPEWHAALLRGCDSEQVVGGKMKGYWSWQNFLHHLRGCEEQTDLTGIAPSLRKLDLRGLKSVKTLPSAMSGLTALRKLNLNGCDDLTSLPDVSSLTSLSIENIPKHLFEWKMRGFVAYDFLRDGFSADVVEIDLRGCSRLTSLPSLDSLKALQKLDLNGCVFLMSLPSLEGLPALQTLNLEHCTGLSSLPSLEGLPALQELCLTELSHLTAVSSLNDCSWLKSLKFLNLQVGMERYSGKDPLLPPLDGLTALQTLDLGGCKNLATLSLNGMAALQTLNLRDCRSLTTLSLDGSAALRTLDLGGCSGLTSLPPLNRMATLQELDLNECSGLTSLSLDGLAALQTLNLRDCRSLTTLSLERLAALQTLNLGGCKGLTSLSLDGSAALQTLDLGGCSGLTSLPPLNRMTTLQELDLNECSGLTSLSLDGLMSLQSLNLVHCFGLKSLSLEGLAALQKLWMLGCSGLTSLSSLAGLTSLQELYLNNCSGLSSLPSLEALPALQTLNLRGCPGLKYPFRALHERGVIIRT